MENPRPTGEDTWVIKNMGELTFLSEQDQTGQDQSWHDQILHDQILQDQYSAPAASASYTSSQPDAPSPVCDSWQEIIQAVLAIVMIIGSLALLHYYHPMAAQAMPPDDLQKQVHELTAQVEQLKQEQGMPAAVLNRYRNSVGYIYGVYQIAFPGERPAVRARVSGTAFIVGNGLLATNRHIAEPWYGDTESEKLMEQGASAMLESLVIFFPGSPTPVSLTPAAVSKISDLAVLRAQNIELLRGLPILPLAKLPSAPGEHVTVIGYPMGIAGMVAKSPTSIYDRLADRHNDINAASELAALSLIRPSATWGHLGDVVGDKLIYDATTAHGGSGGPVFNSKGEVIGVNSAYMDGFSGGTLGVSVDSLRPLIEQAQAKK